MKNTCPNRLTKPLKPTVLHNFNSMLQKQRNMLIPKRKFATFNWTLFVLFISLFIRYHNTREVATHENPERTKDEHSAGSSKPVSNRSPWQELNPASQRPEIGSKQAICAAKPRNRWRKCVPRPCARAHRSICAGGRLYV